MKKIYLVSILLVCFTAFNSWSQKYKLLPDSCTFCAYYYDQTGGGHNWDESYYKLTPISDTVISGKTYTCEISHGGHLPPKFIRQEENKLFGLWTKDSIHEQLIMNFDVSIGDTLRNLYSDGRFYDATVLGFDSISFNNDTVFYHQIYLEGFRTYAPWGPKDDLWGITWTERGICADERGGVLFNTPDIYIESQYADPSPCTNDPLFSGGKDTKCTNCEYEYRVGLDEMESSDFQLYPNPTSDIVNLTFAVYEEKQIEIVDVYGNVILQLDTNSKEEQISLNLFAQGTYLVKISSQNGFKMKRLVVY